MPQDLLFTSNMEHQSSPKYLETLHWLPIKYQILLLLFKSTKGFTHPYLQDLLRPHKNARLTPSSSKHVLDSSEVQVKNIWRFVRFLFVDLSFAMICLTM